MKKKKFNYKLLALSCLSSLLTGVAQAQEVEVLDIPISFSPVTDFMDVTCGSGARPVVYTLVNAEANTINLDNIHVITYTADTATGLMTAFVVGGTGNCIQASTAGIGSGSITGYTTGSATCTITMTVTPPACGGAGQILQKTIDRQLFIGVETREQSELTAEIDAEVSVIGSGASFALLAGSTPMPTIGVVANTGSGSAQIDGNIGSSGASNPLQFSFISDGTFYNNQLISPDPIYTAALSDLASAYTQLNGMTGCMPINGLNNESRGPGCYSLSPASGDTVFVQGTITLTGFGNQNYYFFVTPGTNLEIDSNTVFQYQSTGTPLSTAANVFWIMQGNSGVGMGAGQVLINAGAQLDGSVLSGSTFLLTPTIPAITTTCPGTSHAQVNGTLWSAAAFSTSAPNSSIQLCGDTVSANE